MKVMDGSAFNMSGPARSAQAEILLITFLNSDGLETVPTAFNGRSEYQAFVNSGIPSGGLLTRAERIKTVEEQALFGGKAGVAYDADYHGTGGTVKNLNIDAWIHNTKVGDLGREAPQCCSLLDRPSPTRLPRTEPASLLYRPQPRPRSGP